MKTGFGKKGRRGGGVEIQNQASQFHLQPEASEADDGDDGDRSGLSQAEGKPGSQPVERHKIPLVPGEGREVTRVNQMWSTDITYIRLTGGFVCLAVEMGSGGTC